jgi:hypothetical protein
VGQGGLQFAHLFFELRKGLFRIFHSIFLPQFFKTVRGLEGEPRTEISDRALKAMGRPFQLIGIVVGNSVPYLPQVMGKILQENPGDLLKEFRVAVYNLQGRGEIEYIRGKFVGFDVFIGCQKSPFPLYSVRP